MADLVSKNLGSYTIDALLETRTTGQVFRAHHVRLGRPVTLMVFERSLTSAAGFQGRFQDELRRAAALQHPHIAEISDFGEQDGYYYLVLESIAAVSLRTLLQRSTSERGQVPIALALELARQAADALAYAHSQGQIHGAISPMNLLVARQANAAPEAYTLKISDFGFARLFAEKALQALVYVSPEQRRGLEPDTHSDIYSLGVVLYELTTGAVPFSNPVVENVDQLLQAQPTAPRQIRAEIPVELEAIVLRCLAKAPGQRFATADALVGALQQVQRSMAPGLAMALGASAATAASPGAPAPAGDAPTLAAQRQIQVLDAQGQVLQTVGLTSRGVTIGRAQENDLRLDDATVSRNHLLVALHNSQVFITDLGSENGTLLDGQRLSPFKQHPWDEQAVLRVGQYQLKQIAPLPAAASTVAAATANTVAGPSGVAAQDSALLTGLLGGAATSGATQVVGGRLIGVRLDPEQIALTPGEPATLRVTLTNHGAETDILTLSVAGLPGAWVRGLEQAVPLAPSSQATVSLTISVPRAPESAASDYQVVVRARSGTNPTESGTAGARLSVLPYSAGSLQIAPTEASGRTEAEYRVTLRHEGNSPASYLLSAADNEQALRYTFEQDEVSLEPGQAAAVGLRLGASQRLLGSELPRDFTVRAESSSGPAAAASARFIHQALIPIWLPLALALLALFAVLVNRVLPGINTGATPTAVPTTLPTALPTEAPSPTAEPGAPVVGLFTVAPQVVAPGQPVLVSWDVQGADRVVIEQFGDVPPQGQREHRPEVTTDYRLVAQGGGKTTTRIERVNVVAPEPTTAPQPTAPPPEPTAAPQPTAAPEPTTAPQPTAPPPEPTAAPQPTAIPPPPPPVNLLDLAPNALWSTNAGRVVFGQPARNPESGGWADFASNVTLEDGQLYPATLHTFPTTDTGGFIEGAFDIPRIQAGQFFLADIGFGSAPTGAVSVTLSFSGEIFYANVKQPDGRLANISADLSRFEGRSGRLIMRVTKTTDGSAVQDGLYWVRPRIDIPNQ